MLLIGSLAGSVAGVLACNSTIPGATSAGATYSAEINYVIEHRGDFTQVESALLAKETPGTVHEDLSGLSGCFGAWYQGDFLGLRFDGYEAYHFDADAMEMSYWIVQGSAYIERTARFSIVAPDRLLITETRANGTEESAAALLTLSDSELRIAYLAQDGNHLDGATGDSNDVRVGLVFKRFPCVGGD